MLQEKVLETIRRNNLIHKNDKIVIGVSGGPDSMCLLDILNSLKENLQIELVVAHINHQIRKEAEEETKYVEDFCQKIEVPCYVTYAKVEKEAKEQKLGTEEMGRKIRYQFFEEIAKKVGANKIATAHNANDNVETMLMNLLRGTAISGLKGIEIARKGILSQQEEITVEKTGKNGLEEKRQNEKIGQIDKSQNQEEQSNIGKVITYIRPIREIAREEIEDYCEERKLNPKIDKSNFESIYTRNKIRNELIPYLQKEFNPNIIETLNRLSQLAKEDEEYFAKEVNKAYENLKVGENENEIILDLKKFNQLEKVIKTRLLLYTINKASSSVQGIAKIHLEDILKLCENNIGNKYLMPNKRIKIYVKKGKIFFITKSNLP